VPVVLALEPDATQAAALKLVVRDRVRAELVVAESKDAALAAIRERVPDLILLTALLSPRDEAEIADLTRELEGAEHTQTLTIPLLDLGTSRPAKKKKRGLLSALTGDSDAPAAAPSGCDPGVFAEEIANYLRQADQARAEAALHRSNGGKKSRRKKHDAAEAVVATESASTGSSSYWSWDAPANTPAASVVREPAVETPVVAAAEASVVVPAGDNAGPAADATGDRSAAATSWANPWDAAAPSGDPVLVSPVEAVEALLEQPAPVTAADQLSALNVRMIDRARVEAAPPAQPPVEEPSAALQEFEQEPTLAVAAAPVREPPVAAAPSTDASEDEENGAAETETRVEWESERVAARLPTRAESGALLALQADVARLRQQRASTDASLVAAKAAQERAAKTASETAERSRREADRRAEQAAARAREEAEAERRARALAEERAKQEAERRREAERRAREDAERLIREAAERAREEAARQAREVEQRAALERKARERSEQLARENAARLAREETERRLQAERRAREEAERLARLEADQRVETERKARQEAERKAAAERAAREEAERKAKQETARLEREARERQAHAEAERKAREAAEAHAAAERKARESAERRAREEVEHLAREAERKAQEKAERLAREAEKKAQEHAEQVAREAERKGREAEKKARRAEQAAREKAEHESRQAAAKAKEEALAERRAREEAERRAAAERKARQEMERRANAEREAREQAERDAEAARASTRPGKKTAAARKGKKPAPASRPAAKDSNPRAVQDEWGLYDPHAAGFEALFAKLESIENGEDNARQAPPRRTPRPLAMWAFQTERTVEAAAPADPARRDDFRALVSEFSIPHAVAAVSYASGARIRRVRVPAARRVAPADSSVRVVILSRKLLEAARAEAATMRGSQSLVEQLRTGTL
jgi:hypothetical protein